MAGSSDRDGARSGRALRAGMLAALGALLATPLLGGLAGAQEAEQLTLDVKRIVVPDTRKKLTNKGVRVKAGCNLDCVLVVKVKLPKDVAQEVGVKNRVIGSGAAGAKANRPRWVRAGINKGAGRLLEDFQGSGRLEVRIKALP